MLRPVQFRFLDLKAAELLKEARQWFRAAGLDRREWVADGGNILLLGWRGDATHDALALLLTTRGLHASNEGAAIRVFSADQKRLGDLLTEIATGPGPTATDLQIKPEAAIRGKLGIACGTSRSLIYQRAA